MNYYLEEAGRKSQDVGLNVVGVDITRPQDWGKLIKDWRDLGVTHLDVSTREGSMETAQEHIDAIRRFKEESGN
jgi:hypothetical protein